MAASTLECSTEERVKVKIKFPHFKSTWEGRAGDICSDTFAVRDWSLCLALACKDSLVSLYFRALKSGRLPLTIARARAKYVEEQEEWIGDSEVSFMPDWCDWEEDRLGVTHTDYGWEESETEQALLRHVERHGDCLSLEVTVNVAVRRSMDFASCLRMPRELTVAAWSDPCSVTLKGEDEASVSVPRSILMHFSPVFAAALSSPMAEGRSNSIDLDAPRETLLDLRICFIHGGLPCDICTSLERIVNLLVLASKYAIAPLVNATTYFACVGLSRSNVAKVLLTADRHSLLPLLHAAILFAARSEENFEFVRDSVEYNEYSADLVRLVSAYSPAVGSGDDEEDDPPPGMQWGDVDHEFDDLTDWVELSQDELRRACLERFLGTSGRAAELILRLSSHCAESRGPPAKRQKTDSTSERPLWSTVLL
eukprot:TRINITY_DN30770_c0_g1_i1.p1 TRINITY_DN30770_c0_g1~~TRINITY_DN30770_c0_g1_i1.p1  ORF type:complete len:425 (+),score=68.01 TRINITY_DN30770_c0_g1_i1:93-1367(+)